jgi:hypothetical protein
MSLKEKAKTLNELLWENRLEWDRWLRMGVTEQKQIELAPKYQEKWIKLENAQKEIDEHGKNNEALAKVCSNLNDKILRLENERLELKQKLQQLLNEFPSKDGGSPANWRVNMYSTREIDEWKKKFEELLKEEKAKPT